MKAQNIYENLPVKPEQEVFEELARKGQVKIERIISQGHKSPQTGWYDQALDEWVMLLKGEAMLSFEENISVRLKKGDYLHIPAHRKHRVDWTDPETETIWLAVHY